MREHAGRHLLRRACTHVQAAAWKEWCTDRLRGLLRVGRLAGSVIAVGISQPGTAGQLQREEWRRQKPAHSTACQVVQSCGATLHRELGLNHNQPAMPGSCPLTTPQDLPDAHPWHHVCT